MRGKPYALREVIPDELYRDGPAFESYVGEMKRRFHASGGVQITAVRITHEKLRQVYEERPLWRRVLRLAAVPRLVDVPVTIVRVEGVGP